MATDSDTSPHILTIGIECESLENDSWGIARMIAKLLEQLAQRPALSATHRFVLYFNARVPDLPFLKNPLFTTKVVGLPRWGLKSSFSIYYYVLLPLQLWLDRPSAMYWPNYMLPLINPPFVPSLVMLTEDIWQAMREPQLALRYRIAYCTFATWAAKTATAIMAISRSSAATVSRLFQVKRIVINELAVDTPHAVEPMSGEYVLSVAQAFPRRHLRETITAFARVAADDRELRLIAIGPNRYPASEIASLIAAMNAKLGRPAIQHIERVGDDELVRFYAGAQAFVYVSDTEAFGLPPLEAFSYGVPVVVADTPISHEHFGDHALYVRDPQDIEQFAHAMQSALAAGARERTRQAVPAMLERYTWAAHADRFLEHISRIAT